MSNKVVKAGIGYTIGNFLVKGINFLTIPIFARLLSVSDYGLYNTYLAYEGIFFSIVGLALQMSLKNAKYKYGDKYYSYISSILLLEILLMIAWILIIIVFHGAILTSIGYGYFISFLLIVQCTSSSVLSLYNIHLSLNYSFKSYVIVTAFNALMNISISILLILTIFYNERFVGRVIGTVIPLALLCVLICIKFWKNNTPRINWDYWKYGVSYSLPLIPHAISQVILNQFDRVMINEIKGAAYAGIYSFAYNIFMIISVVMYSLDNVWSPWFYENFQKKNEGQIKRKSTQYALGMFFLSVTIMLISPELVIILGTDEYYDAVYSVIPICSGGFFMFLYSIPSQVEYYLGKTRYIALGTAVAAILNVSLNLYFIPQYGYISAAYTTELAYIFYFIMHYLIARKLLKYSIFDGYKLFILGFVCVIISFLAVLFLKIWIIRWGSLGLMVLVGFYYMERKGITIQYILQK